MVTNTKSLALRSFVMCCAAASIAVAPPAAADPALPVPGSGSASDAINQLQVAGYDVQVNWLEGRPNVPLRECSVIGIHDPNLGPPSTTSLSTVYVDVTCPNAK
jgi:hypothetical protein